MNRSYLAFGLTISEKEMKKEGLGNNPSPSFNN